MTASTITYCTCHSIRENAHGVSFSYYILGVLCPSCEAVMADWEEQDRRAAMTPAERIAEDIAIRWRLTRYHARDYRPRPGRESRQWAACRDLPF